MVAQESSESLFVAAGPRFRIVRTRIAALAGAARRHPDALALLVIVLVATGLRLAFLYRPPLFIRPDSVAYFRAGYELARGGGLDLQLHRTPGYPLLLAGTIWLLGEDLQAIAFVQHVAGVLTAVLAYLIGRRVYGRLAGLLAGLLVALSGPLLIHEHSLMAETLFTFLVSLAFWALVRGPGGAGWLALGSGAALGLAFLTRPVGLVVLPALWLAVLLRPSAWRRRLAGMGLVAVGFVGVAAPVLLANLSRGGEASPAAGTFLYDRVARHDVPPVVPRASSPPPTDDPRRAAARRALLKLVPEKASRAMVDRELRQKLGLGEAEANRAMRDVALEIIADQRQWYVERTLLNARGILLGENEALPFHWASRDRRDVRDPWLAAPSIAHLLGPKGEGQRREQPAAEALSRLFQPAQHRATLGVLILVGLAWSVARPAYRAGLALGLAALALVLAGAALIGEVPRYRYPADPLLAVLAGGGVGATLAVSAELVGRLRRGRVARENVAMGYT